jgi:hypothetical protein
VVQPGWQKPLSLLKRIIKRYMLQPGCFVLDAFSGTAATSVAAIYCGMQAFAFDSNPRMIAAGLHRVEHFRNKHDEFAEVEKTKENPKKRPAPDDDDEEQRQLEEDDAAALEAYLENAGVVDNDEPQDLDTENAAASDLPEGGAGEANEDGEADEDGEEDEDGEADEDGEEDEDGEAGQD